jgi:hypothetical protein
MDESSGQIAQACPDYMQATNYIVNAIADRLKNMRSGRSLALRPGITDLQAAIALSKQTPSPQPVSENELHVLGVRRTASNLLEPSQLKDLESSSQPLITQGASFAWDAYPGIPEEKREKKKPTRFASTEELEMEVCRCDVCVCVLVVLFMRNCLREAIYMRM